MEPQPAAMTLELALGEPVDNRLGLQVAALRLTIRNQGRDPIEVPAAGMPMMVALRTHLRQGGAEVVRSTGTGKAIPPRTRTLAAGESVEVTVSPLDDGPGESPLAAGEWSATICLGDACSNPVSLTVAAP